MNSGEKRLTQDQVKNIEIWLPEIKQKIVNSVKYHKNPLVKRGYNNAVKKALSYIPEVTLSFDPQKCKKEYFGNYVAMICCMRMLDEVKKDSDNMTFKRKRSQYAKAHKVRDINSLYPPVDAKSNFINKVQINENIQEAKNSKDDPEWNDTKSYILKKMWKYFSKTEDTIYIRLIKEHLLPKIEGELYKSVKEIAQEAELSYSYVNSLVKDDRMKLFIDFCVLRGQICR